MSEQYQLQGDYGATAATQTTLRKKWSNLAITTAVLNVLLFVHVFFSPFIMNVLLGIPAEARKVSFSEYNSHLNIALTEGSIYVFLSIVALVVNIRFFRSLRHVSASTMPDSNIVMSEKTFRFKKLAAGLLIAFPSVTLTTVAVSSFLTLYL
jgi:hypothetical protein